MSHASRWWIERVVAGLLLITAASPFWAGHFLPFLDLPQHLALSTIITRYADSGTGFADFYQIDSHITPYVGFYAVMHLLMTFGVGALMASRLMFTMYAIGLPLAAAFTLTTLGRDWRWAVFTVPFIYNANLFWGFANFLLSLPLFLLALGLAFRMFAAATPARPDTWRLAGTVALVSLFHAQTYALLGLCVAPLFGIHWRGWRWAARCVAPFTLSLLLFTPWAWRTFVPTHAATVLTSISRVDTARRAIPTTRYEPIESAFSKIPERLVGGYNDGSDYRISLAVLALFAAALIRGAGPKAQRFRAMLVERRGELLSILLLASYFVTPIELAGQWYVSPRHLVFAALLAPTWLATPAVGFRRIILVATCIVAGWSSLNAAVKVRAFQDQVGPFAQVLDHMVPGKRVMNLMFDDGSDGPVRYWPFLHWSCYYQAEKGGDVSLSFAGVPSRSVAAVHAMPVSYRPGMQPPHSNEWRPWAFQWNTMGPAYDYFLIRGQPQGDAARLDEHADLIIQAREWQLWRRRGETQ